MEPGEILYQEVLNSHPNVIQKIQFIIQPHKIESFIRILNDHIKNLKDLSIFNTYRENIHKFLLAFATAIRKNFPTPGDAYGIQLTCRITKNDTQDTLDSRHLRKSGILSKNQFNVESNLNYELNCYSNLSQITEISGKRKYSTLFVKNYSVEDVLRKFPNDSCKLCIEDQFNKGRDIHGKYRYLNSTRFFVTESRLPNITKIIYCNAKDIGYLLRHLNGENIWALSDIKYVFQKCGIVCYYFTMISLIRAQLMLGEKEEHDIFNIVKYQCRTGKPLPLNRDGLAKNYQRSPLEVLSFEAPKRNYVKYITNGEAKDYKVSTSADKIFFGQQFNEGTGYKFELLPKNTA